MPHHGRKQERTPFYDMIRNLDNFDAAKEVVHAAVPAREEIVRLNFEDQLYNQGIKADGSPLPPYKEVTVQKKEAYSAQGGLGSRGVFERDQSSNFRDTRTDHMTLKDTGFFQRSGKVVFRETEFEIVADDLKYSDAGGEVHLKEIYGDEILGLTDGNLNFIIEKYVRPNLQFIFRHRLFADKNTF